MFVARDKDNSLYLYYTKPTRINEEWVADDGFLINSELFPELKWEDEPIEVELLIRKKELITF